MRLKLGFIFFTLRVYLRKSSCKAPYIRTLFLTKQMLCTSRRCGTLIQYVVATTQNKRAILLVRARRFVYIKTDRTVKMTAFRDV